MAIWLRTTIRRARCRGRRGTFPSPRRGAALAGGPHRAKGDGGHGQGEVGGYPLSGAINIHWSEDGDHSLKPRVASGRTESQNINEGIAAVAAFLQKL